MGGQEEFEWVPESYLVFRVGDFGDRKCRFTVALYAQCGKPAVAAIRRNTRWWYYCGDHLYGRRIRNGQVEFRRRVDTGG